MDDVYMVVRSIYFVWAVILFWYMVYWGIQDVIIGRRCGHTQIPPEHTLFAFSAVLAAFVLGASLAEVFLKEVPGGWRVFLPIVFLVPATAASVQGAFRVKMHRLNVELGACAGGHTHDEL